MRSTILLIQDDIRPAEFLRRSLEEGQYQVRVSAARIGLKLAEEIVPDLVLLDSTIRSMKGLDVCRSLKAHPTLRRIPLMILSENKRIEDKIEALDLGADDYVTIPIDIMELLARIRVQLRRQTNISSDKCVRYGKLTMNPGNREVFWDGREVALTATEFELLQFLIENKGRVLSRPMILNHVCGAIHGNGRTIDVHITHLRRKISILSEAITTIKFLGYKLKANAEFGMRNAEP